VSAIQVTPANLKEKTMAKYTMAVTVMMTGIAAHKIRKFEEFGLCKPARTTSRQRLYSDSDIELIRQILILEKDRVNLPGIKIILAMQSSPKNSKKGGEKCLQSVKLLKPGKWEPAATDPD
jgi:MerR family transcriptional regulator, heat shock protein HspR